MKWRGMSDRLVFPRAGQQRVFMLQAKEKLGCTWDTMGKIVDAHPRSLRDWAREKHNMSYPAALRIARKSSLSVPKNTRVKNWNEHLKTIGVIGRKSWNMKYSRKIPVDEEYRKRKWREWWEREGQHKEHPIIFRRFPVNKPPKSQKLAEFIGIVLGDGGITYKQIIITLHREDDKAYSKFVKRMINELFEITPGSHQEKHANADAIYISRTDLVEYFTNDLGLKIGDKVKQQVDVPKWIKQDSRFLLACVRGLIDTDGCVFTHTYKVSGKAYSYKKLQFTNRSRPLLSSVYNCLQQHGLNPRLTKRYDVWLDSKESMRRYFKLVGTHNPKHLKRYQS